jgi:cytochrome c-type biogenesis protein CcmH
VLAQVFKQKGYLAEPAELAGELAALSHAASHADLAIDLKNQIREQLQAGRSEREILDYMVQRYGDFVLYNPPVKPVTWLLWGGPFVLLVGMLSWLWVTLRRRRALAEPPPLSDDELRRARELLGSTPK